jgi:3-oxoacyl-[acyl-carrier-protein] synthase-3
MNLKQKLYKQAVIIGLGHQLPSRKLTNQYFVDCGLDTSDEWIKERTGIESRYICSDTEMASDLAFSASNMAMHDAKIEPKDIDLIIVATTSGDYLGFPSMACLLQDKLGLKHVGAFDLAAACSGFSYALATATAFIQSNTYRCILVVGVDCLSRFTDFQDRGTCILFGDGAGAVVLRAEESGFGVLYSKLYSDGSVSKSLMIPSGGSKAPINEQRLLERSCFIKMEGKAVFKTAVSVVVPAIKEALEALSLSVADVTYFVCHQANKRILDYIATSLSIRDDQMPMNIRDVGNTSAASIPLLLSEINCKNKLQRGNIVVLVGFGAGFTWGVNIIRWR